MNTRLKWKGAIHQLGLLVVGVVSVFPVMVIGDTLQEITWDDLIPPGVEYSEIIGNGEMDLANDVWRPVYDANGIKLNDNLDGRRVKIPGFIIPIDLTADGVGSFVLVPYVGACIHTPPPPPNQLVFVETKVPWPSDDLWNPVWVTGKIKTEIQNTEVAETGYSLTASHIEVYQ